MVGVLDRADAEVAFAQLVGEFDDEGGFAVVFVANDMDAFHFFELQVKSGKLKAMMNQGYDGVGGWIIEGKV